MPAIPGGTLATLRTTPQYSKLYLVIQQPSTLWTARVDGNPAGDAGDLVATLTIDGGAAAETLLDGMTVIVGSTAGARDRGVFYVRGDQNVAGATVALDIGSSSEIVDNIADDDFVSVLEEWRLNTRYPRVTEAAGVLTFYKDYDLLYSALGGTAATRRQASLPAVPIMGPPRVAFIDLDDTVDIDFDWSDSYTTYPASVVNAWDSDGQRGTTSGDWASAAENPAAQTYDGSSVDANNDISGLAGYRVWMELGTNQQDPAVQYRRGVRYVYTLRRPGETVAGVDPTNAEPITDFNLDSLAGTFDEGGWSGTITVHGSQASETEIIAGSMVIVFAEDWYGGSQEEIGPISGSENVLFVGAIADDSIRVDSETGDTTFDVLSNAGLAKNREMYPIPIENDDGADEWYEAPDLTTDRAAWHYIIWHTTIPTIADWYWSGNGYELRAMDFDAGDIYGTIDAFYQDRLFARLLCDRYGRFSMPIDIQMGVAGAGVTTFTLTTADWTEQLDFRETIELPVSYTELGALNYDAGLITPFLAKAPGTVNRLTGSNTQSMNLAIDTQANLNTLSGRWLAYQNILYPESTIPLAGNWRYFDIWPQEYIVVNTVTDRHTFSDNFIVRGISFEYEPANGALFVTLDAEIETDGIDGQTIEIPLTIPPWVVPPPIFPPSNPPTPFTPSPGTGRRIISTDVGVFVTDGISSTSPVWYAANAGLTGAIDLNVYDIKRDPWHWWTSGGTERTLWAGTRSGIWQHDNFPFGAWVNTITLADINIATGQAYDFIQYTRLGFSIEREDIFAFIFYYPGGVGAHRFWVCTVDAGVIQTATQLGVAGNNTSNWPAVEFAQHSAGNTIYASRAHRDAFVGYSLYRTVNRGAGWALVDGPENTTIPMRYASLAIPYVDATATDQDIYWGWMGENYIYSPNAGGSFSSIVPPTGVIYSKLGTGYSKDHLWFLAADPATNISKWSNNGGISYFDMPLVIVPLGNLESQSGFANWSGNAPEEVLIGGVGGGGFTGGHIYQWSPGLSAWSDKTGNLESLATITRITQIDRDSMGTA